MKKKHFIKIGFCQSNPKFGNKEKNIETIKNLLKKTQANLFVLPELFNTGYTFCSKQEVYDLAEEIPNGFTTTALIKLAQEKKSYFVAGLAEKNKKDLFNSVVLVGPEGYIDTYRKAHLFNEEKKWFSPGNTSFKVYDLKFAKIGIMICFDWFFPEVARILALKGAQIICHSANLILPFCQKAMITRSIENHVFTITCNRIGKEKRNNKEKTFTGLSQITDFQGNILAKANRNREKVQIVEIDPFLADNKKINKLNDLFKDRRRDLYQKYLSSDSNS